MHFNYAINGAARNDNPHSAERWCAKLDNTARAQLWPQRMRSRSAMLDAINHNTLMDDYVDVDDAYGPER